jgi:hypothetical protein
MARAAKKGKKVSWRRRAAWRLADLRRLSSVLRWNGEILDPDRWLPVLANTLGSAPEGPVTTRRGPDAPEVWRLDYHNLALAARRCEVEATREQIEAVVKKTRALQEEAARSRAGRLLPMRPDEIARRLGVTADIRREARAWSIGATDETPAERTEAQREKDRLRKQDLRRDAGATPRAEYEAHSLSCTKPWEDLGISRRTWERQRHAADVVSPAVINKVSQVRPAASPSVANSLSRVRPSQVRRGPMDDRVASPSPPNTSDTTPAAFAARGNRRKAPSDRKIGKGSPKKKVKSSVSNKARHRGSPRAEYHHPPGGLGMIAAARVERPTVPSATDQQAAAEPEPAADGEPGAACASPTESPLPASPTGDGGSGAAYASQPESPAFVSAALHENVSEVARCDFGHSAVAEDIHRQLANLVGLPGGLKARRDPPAVIGPTDRFCASCGDYASNEWPIGDGRHEWRCPDCEPPLTAPRHVEVGLAARAARSAA